jgi:hypothetical protein
VFVAGLLMVTGAASSGRTAEEFPWLCGCGGGPLRPVRGEVGFLRLQSPYFDFLRRGLNGLVGDLLEEL